MDAFNPDQFLAEEAAKEQIGGKPTNLEMQSFDPDRFIKEEEIKEVTQLEQQYGTPQGKFETFMEGLMRKATLGHSDKYLIDSGRETKESLNAKRFINPGYEAVGSGTGYAGLVGTLGFAGPIAAGLGGGTLAAATALGVESAILSGLGAAITEDTLGDHELTAEEAAAHMGTHGLFGAALGGLGGLAKSIPSVLNKGVKFAESKGIQIDTIKWITKNMHKSIKKFPGGDMLSDILRKGAKLLELESLAKQTAEKIAEGAVSVFKVPATRGAILSAASRSSEKGFEKNLDVLKKFRESPELFMNNLSEDTTELHNAAPKITSALYMTAANAGQFLESKIPKAPVDFPMGQKWEPNKSQKQDFNEYYNAVNNPLSVFDMIKDGTLSTKEIEALTAVHPKLLEEMRRHIFQNMDVEKAIKLPYATKIALGKFLGQPPDQSMTPAGLAANQMALNMNRSQQSVPKSGRKTTQGGLKELGGIPKRSNTWGRREQQEGA